MLQGACITEKKKDASALRDQNIAVRASKKEKTKWEQSASKAGLSLSDHIRHRMNSPDVVLAPLTRRPRPCRKPPRRSAQAIDPQLIRALNSIGNNINQIARHLHTIGTLELDVLHALTEASRALDRIAVVGEKLSQEVDHHAD